MQEKRVKNTPTRCFLKRYRDMLKLTWKFRRIHDELAQCDPPAWWNANDSYISTHTHTHIDILPQWIAAAKNHINHSVLYIQYSVYCIHTLADRPLLGKWMKGGLDYCSWYLCCKNFQKRNDSNEYVIAFHWLCILLIHHHDIYSESPE